MFVTRRDFLKSTGTLTAAACVGGELPAIAQAAAEAATDDSNASETGERYVNTICVHCVNFCGQRIKLTDGVMRAVYPNPDIAEYYNHGICPKGGAGPFNTYNPYRIKAPLKRTNPNKGIGEDPGWVEISWEEAFDEIAGRLAKIRGDDPRKLIWHHGHGKYLMGDAFPKAWCAAFGTPNVVHRTTTCEAARHVADELTWGYHNFLPDLEHTRLLLNFGASYYEAEQWARWLDHASTDAMARGMKMVSIEPRFSQTSAKAQQWVPIRPGTDAAMLLAMAKVLIDEGLIDQEFLLTYTNAPQLVAAAGHIQVDDAGGQPLVWDTVTESARPLAEGVLPALTGTYGNSKARTAFQVLVDTLADVTPERAEEITGVPAETIRALAKEFGQAAMIGSTVRIDDHQLRYRPVAIHSFRGLAAKEFGTQNWRAAQIVMMLVGAQDAVGGLGLHDVYKKPAYFEGSKCEYPPQRVDLQESIYFPHATHNVCQQVAHTLLDPQAYGLPYQPEMQIFYATNRVFSTADATKQLAGYANLYNVVIDLVLTETASLADIVLPDLSYLESWHFAPTRWTPNSKHTAIRQPLVNAYDIPYDTFGIMWELAKRLGMQQSYVENMNRKWKNKNVLFDPTKEDYTPKEAVAVLWEDRTGLPLDYAIEHGFRGKHVDTAHRFLDGIEKQFKAPDQPKMKLYADQLVASFNKIAETVAKEKVKNLDLDYYRIAMSPLPLIEHATPTPHKDAEDYPVYLLTYKRMYRNQAGNTAQNPILNALGDSDSNFVLINPVLAQQLGVADGDEIRIETRVGAAQGKARFTQGIRPDVVAVSYSYGHFSPNFPDYAKKGIWINQALELHPDVVSGMNSFNDTKCQVVKA